MIDIDVRINADALTKLKIIGDPKGVTASAVRSSMNHALSAGYSLAKKRIGKEYTVSKQDIEALTEIKKARKNELAGYLTFGGLSGKKPKGRMLTTAHFTADPASPINQTGITNPLSRSHHTLSIKQGKASAMKHLFMIRNDKFAKILWQRTGVRKIAQRGNRKGKKVDEMMPFKSVSMAQMANEETREAVQNKMLAAYEKWLPKAMERCMKKVCKGALK